VCKKFLLGTLCVGEAMVKGWVQHAQKHGNIVSVTDGRAGREPKNKTAAVDLQCVETFLCKLPVMPSHYCRKDTNLLYLEAGWTNRKLYKCVLLRKYNTKASINEIF